MNIEMFVNKLIDLMKGTDFLTKDNYIKYFGRKDEYIIYTNLSPFNFNLLLDLYNMSVSQDSQTRYIRLILAKSTLEGMYICVKTIGDGVPIKVSFDWH